MARAKAQYNKRSIAYYGYACYYRQLYHQELGHHGSHSVGGAGGDRPLPHPQRRGRENPKMVALPDVTPEVLLATNKSVESMVNAVSRLEMILQSKLSSFNDCLCQPEIGQE